MLTTTTICFLTVFYLQVEAAEEKFNTKREADPQNLTPEVVHQSPLTLQIPTFIPQFDPSQSPVFNLATTNSFHALPLVQPQTYQNEELQVSATHTPGIEAPVPPKEVLEENLKHFLDPRYKGVVYQLPSRHHFNSDPIFLEPKTLAANNVPTVIPKGVVHLNPQNVPRYQNYRNNYNPKGAAQNLYYVNHPVRLPHINYHVLPVSGHQRQYAPIVYHNHPPLHNYRPHHPHIHSQPLVNSRIRHPINPNPQRQNFNPPRIYGGFRPMPPPQPQPKEEQKEEEENEEINEDHEDDREEEEERPERQQEEKKDYKSDFDIDDFFKHGRYSFPKFGEEEEHAKQKEERGNGSYEVEEDHEALEEDDEESKKTFVVTNPFRPRPTKLQKYGPSTTIHYGKPKEEYKAFSYSKKVNYPKKEVYQGRGSENIPVIHRQKSLEQNWYITKSSL